MVAQQQPIVPVVDAQLPLIDVQFLTWRCRRNAEAPLARQAHVLGVATILGGAALDASQALPDEVAIVGRLSV